MSKIGPRFTHAELQKAAQQTVDGDGAKATLPGVVADAKSMKPEAHAENRKLADAISKAVASIKNPNGEKVPPFVLSWRLYPNSASSVWEDNAGTHACGCGCGCFSSHQPTPGGG